MQHPEALHSSSLWVFALRPQSYSPQSLACGSSLGCLPLGLSQSAALPPQKKHVASVFSSPNCDQLKEALQSRGACEFDAKKGKSDEVFDIVTYL